ncbi:phosphotransferase [Achromobacter aloeverae]
MPPSDFPVPPAIGILAAQARPVPLSWARDLAVEAYGLDAELTPLSGERDANFLARASDGQDYMLKISHPSEPEIASDFQTQALLHIARADPALPVQRIVPALDGSASLRRPAPDGLPRVVRLIRYLPGLPMPKTARTASQRAAVASMLARTDLALAGLRHPARELQLPWDLQRADAVAELLDHVPDAGRRALARDALRDYVRDAQPGLSGLRRQPIHNDFNLYNLLVDEADHDRIVGILDFGDMMHAPMVNDLAVAASYQVDESGDALAAIVGFAAAYHAVLPLTSAEIDVLYPLIRARLAMVVAISGWRAARNPANADYLLRNNAISWARLARCATLPPARVRDALRDALPRRSQPLTEPQ